MACSDRQYIGPDLLCENWRHKNLHMVCLYKQIWELVLRKKVTVTAEYLVSTLNKYADKESHRKTHLIFKISSKHVLKTSSTRLQHNSFCLPRRLEDILKTSWQMKNCYTEDVFKTSWRHVLRSFGRHAWETFWRHVLKTTWSHLGDKQNVYREYLYLTNLNVYLTNLYFTNLYLTNLRQAQNH